MTDTVLITGGSDGIGLGLAARFLAAGATVLVTGRSSERLAAAKARFPGLRTLANDVADPAEREALVRRVQRELPGLTWLVNNAGIQRRIALAADDAPWPERQAELDVLLAAPIHLSHLFAPMLIAQPGPTAIVNVTSGGAFVPQTFAPAYSACKAALHHFTITLRHALASTSCRVVELIPPAVRTALAPSHGAELDPFCDAVFAELTQSDALEIGYGPTKDITKLSRADLDAAFTASATRAAVRTY